MSKLVEKSEDKVTPVNVLFFFSRLKDWLQGYLMEQEPPAMDVKVLANFPDNILYKHAVALWIRGYNMLCEKQDGR